MRHFHSQRKLFFATAVAAAAIGSQFWLASSRAQTAPATTAPTTQGAKTASGLTVIELQDSAGEAKTGDTVWVHFSGFLADGTKFASSIERGEPVEMTLGVGDVLKAWDEGIVGMKVGEKRKLIVPPELAYGKNGQGSLIPPNATLTFEIELVGLRRAPETPQPITDPVAAATTEPTASPTATQPQ